MQSSPHQVGFFYNKSAPTYPLKIRFAPQNTCVSKKSRIFAHSLVRKRQIVPLRKAFSHPKKRKNNNKIIKNKTHIQQCKTKDLLK